MLTVPHVMVVTGGDGLHSPTGGSGDDGDRDRYRDGTGKEERAREGREGGVAAQSRTVILV